MRKNLRINCHLHFVGHHPSKNFKRQHDSNDVSLENPFTSLFDGIVFYQNSFATQVKLFQIFILFVKFSTRSNDRETFRFIYVSGLFLYESV